MSWSFNNSIPIYVQLVEGLKMKIISGEILPGAKLPSVRDLAEEAGVNPNTMQRALAELERENLIFSLRTSGRFVTEDEDMIREMKKEIASQKIDDLFETLVKMGYSRELIGEIVLRKINQFGKEVE